MQRVGVISCMHCNSIRVVVDGNINVVTDRHFYSGTGTTTTSKIIHNDFVIHAYLSISLHNTSAAVTIDGTGRRSNHIRLTWCFSLCW